jgi:membrane protease YdiL (CAAX protease family)
MFHGWKSHPLVTYFVLTYAISWLTLGWVALASHGLLPFNTPSGLRSLLLLVGSSGPLLAALLLVATTTGKGGWRAFFRQFLIWRVGLWWYLVVLLEPALVTLLVQVGSTVFGGASFNLAHPPVIQRLGLPPGANPWLLLVPVFLLGGLVGGPLGEEPGWRGYALARIQDRSSALVASLILGVLWGVWHLPFFFIKGATQENTPFFLFVLGIVASSVLITWVYNHTKGSVLLALLFHNSVNITALYLPLSLVDDWQGVLAQCLVALIVVITAGPAYLAWQLPYGQTTAESE